MTILISKITATAKTRPHLLVLNGRSGSLLEDDAADHVFVSKTGSQEHNGGPEEGSLYKLKYDVAGEFETIQKMTFVGYAPEYSRYVFSKKR